MKITLHNFTKISKGLFVLAFFAIILSSCSQRITGNYKTNRMEIEQAVTLNIPENTENKVTSEDTKVNEQVAQVERINKIKENSIALKSNNLKKELKKKIREEKKQGKNADKTIAATKHVISALPLLAMNNHTKSAKAPMRDFLVLGIVLLVIGLVLGIFGGIFGVVGAILAVIGLVLIILYIVDAVV